MSLAANVQAAELTPLVGERQIGARVRELAFPSSLRKDLRSGLTNRFVVRVTMLEGTAERANAVVEIALKYDLWDERFRSDVTINGVSADAPVLRTVDEVLSWIGDLRFPELFARPAVGSSLTLRAEALLNPIERERMERIREWVKENSRYVPFEGGTPGAAAESSPNSVFNKIFEHYSAGQDVAADWRDEIVSAPFDVGAR